MKKVGSIVNICADIFWESATGVYNKSPRTLLIMALFHFLIMITCLEAFTSLLVSPSENTHISLYVDSFVLLTGLVMAIIFGFMCLFRMKLLAMKNKK